MNSRRLLIASVVGWLALVAPTAPAHASIASGMADAVWGQPNFVSSGCSLDATTSATLCHPTHAVLDAAGNLWVADWFDSRVLLYQFDPATGRPSTTATKVFGQYDDFTTHGCNEPPPPGSGYPAAPSQYTLCNPNGLAVDRFGTLYVADQNNNRVLVYFDAANKAAEGPADLVLGQPNFSSTGANDTRPGGSGSFTCGTPNPASNCTLFSPEGLSVDSDGNLLVADTLNNRVMLWSLGILRHAGGCTTTCFIPASMVWGQYGSFNTNCPNQTCPPPFPPYSPPPPTAATLNEPHGAISDDKGNLFIADSFNNRVLEYNHALSTGRQSATMVYGQNGNFTTNAANFGGVSAASLSTPVGLTLDRNGNLWVSDELNNRVLEYPPPGGSCKSCTVAINVLGQRGSFTTNGSNEGGLDAGSFDAPTGIAFDRAGNAYVADQGNNDRILAYFAP